eukprot:6867764-Prymnesium_polylepis.1
MYRAVPVVRYAYGAPVRSAHILRQAVTSFAAIAYILSAVALGCRLQLVDIAYWDTHTAA